MSDTLAQLKLKMISEYHTQNNQYADFPNGIRVKIITPMCDFSHFYGETGIVVKNTLSYLGIEVRLDEPRKFSDGAIQVSFNFNPIDLWALPVDEKTIVEKTGSMELKRFYSWTAKNNKEVYSAIRSEGWIAAMNEVRKILRDNDKTDNGLIISDRIEGFKFIDEILQKEIEG